MYFFRSELSCAQGVALLFMQGPFRAAGLQFSWYKLPPFVCTFFCNLLYGLLGCSRNMLSVVVVLVHFYLFSELCVGPELVCPLKASMLLWCFMYPSSVVLGLDAIGAVVDWSVSSPSYHESAGSHTLGYVARRMWPAESESARLDLSQTWTGSAGWTREDQ
jgi:hypothetical protein